MVSSTVSIFSNRAASHDTSAWWLLASLPFPISATRSFDWQPLCARRTVAMRSIFLSIFDLVILCSLTGTDIGQWVVCLSIKRVIGKLLSQ